MCLYITAPNMPHYSLANLGAQSRSPMSLLTPGYRSSQPIDMNATITSQTSLSGGKMQYTPPVSQAQPTYSQSQMQPQQSSQQTGMASQMQNSQVDQTKQHKSMQTILVNLGVQVERPTLPTPNPF